MAKAKRLTTDHTLGFVQTGKVILYSDIDSGRVLLGSTNHRDGQHSAILGNRCGECVKLYRTVVLGHDVPTPLPPAWRR